MIDLLTAYKEMWTRALDFKGRSTVTDYWCPFFVNLLITVIAFYLFHSEMLAITFQVIILLPSISLSIRRMHDTNKSGWNILWLYIPTVLLIIYAGAILYYTQSPEIVDLFLTWFTVMVVGYVIFLVYSIYLLTHHTYPKKNHYGEVPHHVIKEEKADSEESPKETEKQNHLEDTMTFKTKAFLEKARTIKQRDTKQKEEASALSKEGSDPKPVKQATQISPATEQAKTAEPEKAIVNSDKHDDEIIVMAQLKPSKKRPIKKDKKAAPLKKEPIEAIQDKKAVQHAVSTGSVEGKQTVKKAIVREEPVQTIAQKRAETQRTMPEPVSIQKEELKKTAKTIHRPVKRKPVKPIEMPDMNVEKIRTHSLDSIAKLVEQNMTKDPSDAPTVVATMKKKPVKRKKKENE